MSDLAMRALARAAKGEPHNEAVRRAAGREECRTQGSHAHRFEGSACSRCEEPDPRTRPGRAWARFGARRFCEEWLRPGDAFEVFDRVTGETKSPGMSRKWAEKEALMRNGCLRGHDKPRLDGSRVLACSACGFRSPEVGAKCPSGRGRAGTNEDDVSGASARRGRQNVDTIKNPHSERTLKVNGRAIGRALVNEDGSVEVIGLEKNLPLALAVASLEKQVGQDGGPYKDGALTVRSLAERLLRILIDHDRMSTKLNETTPRGALPVALEVERRGEGGRILRSRWAPVQRVAGGKTGAAGRDWGLVISVREDGLSGVRS